MRLRGAFRAGFKDRAGWRLALTYDADGVEKFKKAIPHTHRAWFPEAKEWWVSRAFEEEVLAMFPEFEAFLRQPALPGMEALT